MFPLMVHHEMATVPPATKTPPPSFPETVFPWIEEDVIVTDGADGVCTGCVPAT